MRDEGAAAVTATTVAQRRKRLAREPVAAGANGEPKGFQKWYRLYCLTKFYETSRERSGGGDAGEERRAGERGAGNSGETY